MRELNFDLPEIRKIKINGHEFDILKADIDVIRDITRLQKRFEAIKSKTSLDEITGVAEAAAGYVDELLGDGALQTISGGRPVPYALLFQWLTAVCETVIEEYGLTVAAKYDA